MSFAPVREISDPLLKKFINHSTILDNLHNVERNSFDQKWIEIKNSTASAAAHIYKFTSNLILKSEKYIKEKNKYLTEEDKIDIRTYFFQIDLIISKLTSSVFTETPRTSKLDIITIKTNEIAIIGENLEEYIASSFFMEEKGEDYYNIHFQRFCSKLFMLFDFIYSGNEGVFTRFKIDKESYLTTKGKINIFNNNDSKNESYFSNILESTARIIELSFNDSQSPSIEYSKIFKNFIAKNKRETVYIELFLYSLSANIWKILKIVHDSPEYISRKDKNEFIDNLKEHIKEYIQSSIKNIDDFYNETKTNLKYFKDSYKIQNNFLKKETFKNSLYKYKKIETNKDYDWFEFCKMPTKSFFGKEIKSESKDIVKLSGLINTMISNIHNEKFKFYRLLQKNTYQDISFLIDYTYGYLKQKNNLENTHFLGMLRSGSFLAHTLNILNCINNKKNLQSSSILTYPYISIMPREIFDREDKKNIFYIDEAIKSGYSLSVAQTYRKRVLKYNSIEIDNDKAFALVNFKAYDNKIVDDYDELANINIDHELELRVGKVKTIENYRKFDWKSFLESEVMSIEGLGEKIRERSSESNIKRLDITKAISDSFLLFKIAKYFAIKLVSRINNNELEGKNNIIFFQGSYEGKLLSDIIIFTCKILFSENLYPFKIYLNNKLVIEKEKSFSIFIDMTIDSGETLKQVEKIDNEGNEFDLKLFIASKDKLIDKKEESIFNYGEE